MTTINSRPISSQRPFLLSLIYCLVYILLSQSKSAFSWSPSLQISPSHFSRQTCRPLSSHHPTSAMGSLYSRLRSNDGERVCNAPTQDKFRGQTVLLTGASGGLGRCLALQFAHCGCKTLVLSGRSLDSLQKVAKECNEISPTTNMVVIKCDLSDQDSVAKLGRETAPLDVDVLVNNGGISSRSSFLQTRLEVDELLMQVNFLSGASLAKALVPAMVERGSGAILWISSVQGLLGIPNRTSYAASKFAVQGYCEALRGELASSGITVHVASPGYIRTNLSKSAITGDGSPHGKMDSTTERGADPNDVAVTILESVAKNKADFVVAADASAKAAIWLRLLWPSLLIKMLIKRFEKTKPSVEDNIGGNIVRKEQKQD